MVVVESTSMMHDEEGSYGAIDPGDLVMVMDRDRVPIITYVAVSYTHLTLPTRFSV